MLEFSWDLLQRPQHHAGEASAPFWGEEGEDRGEVSTDLQAPGREHLMAGKGCPTQQI